MIEVLLNTVLGYVVAIASQIAIFPLFDIHVALHENLLIGLFFTIISIIRSYFFRRLFEKLRVKGILK